LKRIAVIFLADLTSEIFTAVEFLRSAPEGKYDAIIVDSSDPVGMF
jgi:predicted membrane-bound spermidine synthase